MALADWFVGSPKTQWVRVPQATAKQRPDDMKAGSGGVNDGSNITAAEKADRTVSMRLHRHSPTARGISHTGGMPPKPMDQEGSSPSTYP